MTDFCHTHRHGEFSRLDGVGTAKQYAARAVELGHGFLAQTDHGTLSGALHHIAACKEKGIIPIVGVEAYYRPNRLLAQKFKQRNAYHLILLAKNLRGWHNLLRLVSIAYADPADGGGFYQYPCIDDELIERHHEGLICTTACSLSYFSKMILAGDSVAVRDFVRKFQRWFKDDFYFEISPHDFDDQRRLNIELVSLGKEFGIPLTSSNDVHFVYPGWATTQQVLKMASTNLSFRKVAEMLEKGEEPPYMGELIPNLYLASRKEMIEWYDEFHPDLRAWDVIESFDNTLHLARSIKPFLLDRRDKLPKITDTPEEAERILDSWIEAGLERLIREYPAVHWDKYKVEIYQERIVFEWEILKDKGVIPYMVMVADIVRWAKGEGIRIGLGRGSAAGCLISYLVGITAVDPIPWGLLFERFLNPGRKGLPDIDIDVQSERRDEVKKYIIHRYGADHVADIITHERFQPKSVLQKLCRVYDVPYIEAHAVTDTIDIRQDDEETTLDELLPINEKLREFKAAYPDIWEHATRIEGTVANIGKHAAGVVITPEPIVNYMALERGKRGDLVTSWSDAADFMVISDYGFLKIDLLGIKGLQKHDHACRLIKERHGKDIDLNKLPPLRDPLDVDDDTLDIFCRGLTAGVFQFGSKGITNLIREISPDSALDLAAANALYRPGPMKGGVTWDYARIKFGRKERSDWSRHHLVAPVLDETYGIIAYQEQVMEVAKRLANFSPAQADDLRKAMGKLYRIKGGTAAKKFMAQYDEQWARGTKASKIEPDIATLIWSKFLEFGHYGFNKSHSGCYGLEAYQDAWLKAHYPLEFYAANLTYPSGSTPAAKQEFFSTMIREARMRGIRILPPDVNQSELTWTIDSEEDALRYGIMGIKDVGEVAAALIIKHRATPYTSMDDLRLRCGTKVNKKVMVALVESGAFDEFGARDDASGKQIALWEKARLKMVIKGTSETDKYANLIRDSIYTQDEVIAVPKGTEVVVGGEITKIERKKTKTGKDFANVTVVFDMNEYRVRFWQENLNLFADLLVEGEAILVCGKKDEWQSYISVVAYDVTDVESEAARRQDSENELIGSEA